MDLCAPKFAAAVRAMLAELAGGPSEMVFETLRTPERQAFLYGFGRDYDDGRGIVTNAQTSLYSFHGFGLAVDIVEKDGTPWDAPPGFWENIGRVAKKHGLSWGGDWKKPDRPHVQWGQCPATPSSLDRSMYAEQGMPSVWARYEAI